MGSYNDTIDNKNNIKCFYHTKKERNFYITEDLKVLPCCFYASHRLNMDVMGNLKDFDSKFHMETENDPDWNDISKHTLEEIENHTIYKHHLFEEGWNSDNPSKVCITNCTVKKNQKLVE